MEEGSPRQTPRLVLMCCVELLLRGMPRHFYANGNFVFDRQGEECGRLDFEVGQGSGNRTRESDIGALLCKLKGHVLIMQQSGLRIEFRDRLECWRRWRPIQAGGFGRSPSETRLRG